MKRTSTANSLIASGNPTRIETIEIIIEIISMFKMVIKWLLQVCFKAIIGEIFVEYEKRKEVIYEQTTTQAPEKGEQKNLHDDC